MNICKLLPATFINQRLAESAASCNLRVLTMVTTITPAYPLMYCSPVAPLGSSQQQLRLSCPSNGRRFSVSRNGIISWERSSSPRALVGPFVLKSQRPSGSCWCSGGGLPNVTRRGLVVGSVPVSWIAAGLVSVAATGALAMAAMAGQGGRQQAMLSTRRGMQLFSEVYTRFLCKSAPDLMACNVFDLVRQNWPWQGDVKGSLDKFDEALELDPQSLPYLWQRGLSLYYVDRFEEGAKQFRDDVAVNPNDTEEAIWCFLCEAQYLGVDKARQRFLVVGPDRRPIMKEIYNLFRYGGSTDELLQAVYATEGADYFYANLYAGLDHEAHKRQDAAKGAILAAVHSFYGTRSGDYMAALARVHAKCRGWKVSMAPFA